jgi:hypothetical protein
MNRLKPSMIVVDAMRRITPEALFALLPSTDPFKIVPIPTGVVASIVPVVIQATEQGNFFVQNSSVAVSPLQLIRGSVILDLQTIGIPIPVNPGDVFKFSYVMQAIPANNPKVYILPR